MEAFEISVPPCVQPNSVDDIMQQALHMSAHDYDEQIPPLGLRGTPQIAL